MSVMLYPCIFCVALLINLFVTCCVSDSVCELLGETIRNIFWWSGKSLQLIYILRFCCVCLPSE